VTWLILHSCWKAEWHLTSYRESFGSAPISTRFSAIETRQIEANISAERISHTCVLPQAAGKRTARDPTSARSALGR
jgi:hypothetical protein